jgi:2,4-dienoyl-CoA reductase-like NADH-dependent reductase (Old Yellow Enzyme family)/thioredoxin reductase
MQYPNLFQEGSIGSSRIKNRIVMPAMGTNFTGTDGMVCDRNLSYYRERARGGVGLIIVEAVYIHQSGKHRANGIGAADDRFIPGLQRLAKTIRDEGAVPAIQLIHTGRLMSSKSSGLPVLAPSAVPHRMTGEVPREMTIEDINLMVECFAASAARVVEAGFEMVEVHGAHGYLLQQFLSPYSNRRQDGYGGSFANRARFPLEVVRAVRKRLDDSAQIIYRLSATEFMQGGLTTEEMGEFAHTLQAEGIDALHVSVGINETDFTIGQVIQSIYYEPGNLAKYARAIKANVSIPVIAVGRINSPEVAEAILARGDADFVATGRALFADPYWPRKAREGKPEDIRKCVACNMGCIGRLMQQNDVKCTQNPWVGTDFEVGLPPAPLKKRVLVLGGGPAGLEAARVAAARGHHVTLLEEQAQLGGQVQLGCVPPGKAELQEVVRARVRDLEKLRVEVKCSVKVTSGDIEAAKTDVVIEAIGAQPAAVDIPTDFPEKIASAWAVLAGQQVPGQKVLVVGGGMVGLETADFLVSQGKQVVLIELLDQLGQTITPTARATLLSRLASQNVQTITGVLLEHWGHDGVLLRKRDGSVLLLPDIENVVVAVGARSNRLKFPKLTGIDWKRVGDCERPRDILAAVCEAAEVAIKL